jgi:hypothetical protein
VVAARLWLTKAVLLLLGCRFKNWADYSTNIIQIYTMKLIALHMQVYGISHMFSLNEFFPFFFFIRALFISIRETEFRDDHCKGV